MLKRLLRFRHVFQLASMRLTLQQLALYQEHHVTLRRATNATRIALVWLGRWFDGRPALAVVQPQTLFGVARDRPLQ